MSEEGDVKAAIDAVERLSQPRALPVEGVGHGELVAMPEGMTVVDLKRHLDERRARPERITGTARLSTIESFIEHVKRFADDDSAIFAHDDPKRPKLLAVLDYHEARSQYDEEGILETVRGQPVPRFGVHRAEYAFPLSDPWLAWKEIAGKQLSQADFASFLEDRIADVMNPGSVGTSANEVARALHITMAGPDEIMALARGLSVRVDQKVTQAVNLSTGEASIGFDEAHLTKDGTGPLKVPGGFAVHLPVFRNGTEYALVVRLKYRVAGGGIFWTIQLQRLAEVFDDAFREACVKAEQATDLPLFYGQPES